jgi:uncharacterized protein YrzB (UPF0473 family)
MADKNENMDMAADLYTLVDEDGVEQTFEMIDVMEIDNEKYYALVPYFDDPEKSVESNDELVILKSDFDENNDEILVSIDDDDEYEKIGNMFLERIQDMYNDEE